MNVISLGYRTDLIFPAFDGEILDRGAYLVIRTPSNPTFFWGNFLLFSSPPEEGDDRKWRDLFAEEIGSPPETAHQVFGWDSPDGEQGVIQPFLEAGFRFVRSAVLTARTPHRPARPNPRAQIRALTTVADWDQALRNQVICRDPEFEETSYRGFRTRELARYRNMVKAGLGNWYGAFIDGQLVADLGIFHDRRVGRYQSVQTHPDFRRRGIAGTLVCEAGRQARAVFGLDTLVIVADQGSAPARLYRSVGFQEAEQQVGLEWYPHLDPQRDAEG